MAGAYSPARFDDYFDLDNALSPEGLQVRQTMRKFVDSRVRAYEGQWWQEGNFPQDLVAPLAQLGVFGPTLPEEFGGSGSHSYQLWLNDAGTGTGGLGSAIPCVRAKRIGDACVIQFAGAKTAVLTENGRGETHRVF